MDAELRGKVVIGKNSYCGPFAAGYCAGVSPDAVSKYVRSYTGQRKVTDMGCYDIEATLRHFGCDFEVETPYLSGAGKSLSDWFAARADRVGRYLLFVPGHFLIVDGETVYDNNTRAGVPFTSTKYVNDSVQLAWRMAA